MLSTSIQTNYVLTLGLRFDKYYKEYEGFPYISIHYGDVILTLLSNNGFETVILLKLPYNVCIYTLKLFGVNMYSILPFTLTIFIKFPLKLKHLTYWS